MQTAFYAGASGLSLGIAYGLLVGNGLAPVFLCALLALVLFFLRPSWGVFFFCAALGVLRVGDVVVDAALENQLGNEVVIEGRIIEEPDIRERSTRLSVETDSGARVLVIAQPYIAVQYGERIRAEGTLGLPRRFETGEGRTFDYAGFLERRGIRYELSFADIERLDVREGNVVIATAIAIKHWYLSGLTQSLPEPHAGLAGGITVGDKRGVGEDLGDVFQTVGLTHIVVLSGYNIMIVIVLIEKLLGPARLRLRLAMSIVVALFFVLMTGFASASVRAAAMATIATVGRATGRVYLALNALILVAACMILVNPRLLLFDPGFQLSIVATWGLIALAPLIEMRLTRITERFELRGIMGATIATQIAVLPLLLFQSGMLPSMSLPANFLVLPFVPLAMLLSFIAGLIGAVLPFAAPIFGFPALAVLEYVIRISEALASFPLSTATVPAFSPVVLATVYVLLIALVQSRSAAQSRPS